LKYGWWTKYKFIRSEYIIGDYCEDIEGVYIWSNLIVVGYGSAYAIEIEIFMCVVVGCGTIDKLHLYVLEIGVVCCEEGGGDVEGYLVEKTCCEVVEGWVEGEGVLVGYGGAGGIGRRTYDLLIEWYPTWVIVYFKVGVGAVDIAHVIVYDVYSEYAGYEYYILCFDYLGYGWHSEGIGIDSQYTAILYLRIEDICSNYIWIEFNLHKYIVGACNWCGIGSFGDETVEWNDAIEDELLISEDVLGDIRGVVAVENEKIIVEVAGES